MIGENVCLYFNNFSLIKATLWLDNAFEIHNFTIFGDNFESNNW